MREKDKLDRVLGGIRAMGGRPNMLFIIDTNKEDLAVEEASKLGIPVVAILDSNSCPDKIAYPIPGNDDSSRAIDLYCQLVVSAVLKGLQAEVVASGADLGASEKVVLDAVAELEAIAVEMAVEGESPAAEAPVEA
jgi:small subunit ribosomal protein S2